MSESSDMSIKRFEYPEPATVEKPNLDRFDEAAQELSNRMSSRSPTSSNNSPNQRLADFFKKKGDTQLSEMEVEGVMSLINQAKSQDESLIDLNNLQSPTFQSPAENAAPKKNESAHEGSVSLSSIGLRTPVRMSPASNDSSPVSTPRYSPFYSTTKRPSFPSASKSAKSRKTIHYANIPTPYRPGSRTSTKLSNPLNLSTSQDSLVRDAPTEQSTKEKEPAANKEVEEKKPMSQTASALLSLIGDDEKEDESKAKDKEKEKEKEKHYNDIPDDMKSFVNPYASPARRSSPHKKQRQNLHRESPKPSAIKELEKTMPKDSAAPPPSTSIVDKYKPARSSGLRKSIVPSPEKETPEKKRDRSSSLFKVSPATKTTTTANTTTEPKEAENEQPRPTATAAQNLFKLGSEKETDAKQQAFTTEQAPVPKPTPPQPDEKPGSLFSANSKPATATRKEQETKPSLFSAFGGQSSTTISPSKPLAAAVSNSTTTKPEATQSSPFKFGLSEPTPSTTQFTFPSIPASTFSPSPEDLASLDSLKQVAFFF